MKKVKTLVITAAGINCDIETFNTFKYLGSDTKRIHINALIKEKKEIDKTDILVFPGGFSYGDDIAGGTILANKVKKVLPEILKFIKSGRPVIGICNGFQVLMKTGILPFAKKQQQASLSFNDCGHYIDKWVELKVNKNSPCIFTKGLPETIELPIAHGEGKFVTDTNKTLKKIKNKNLYALRYSNNPNGSVFDIAAVTNEKGNVLGLMPHPERYALKYHHPLWTRAKNKIIFGLEILKNAVKYVR